MTGRGSGRLMLDRQGMPSERFGRGDRRISMSATAALLYFSSGGRGRDLARARGRSDFAMGRGLAGYLGVLGTEADDAAAAAESFAAWSAGFDRSHLDERERAHLDAAWTWLQGDMIGCGELLQEISLAYPRDLLALVVGHQIDFFTGNATEPSRPGRRRAHGLVRRRRRRTRSCSECSLSGWRRPATTTGARRSGARLSSTTPRTSGPSTPSSTRSRCRAVSARALRFSTTGPATGRRATSSMSTTGGTTRVYALEAGRPDVAPRHIRPVLHNDESAGLAIEMLDASSLLWRLYLDGADESVRWKALSEAWDPKMRTAHYAFNDMHAVMSYVGSGRIDKANALIAARRAYLESAREAREQPLVHP